MSQTAEKARIWDRILDALDTPWERPSPSRQQQRRDILTWFLFLTGSMLMLLAYLSIGVFEDTNADERWKEFVAVAGMTLPLAFRRKFPITMMVVGTVLFYVLGYWATFATSTFASQIAYFAVLYTSVAWAKDRRNLWIVYVLVMLTTVVWMVVNWTIQGSAYSFFGDGKESMGPFSIAQGTFIYGLLINGTFYGGALLLGNMAWRSAYQQEILKQQREQILVQSDRLAQDAVIEDRLRIARELHDSIGHHIAAIGIQASAATCLASKKPEALAEPLHNIEELARTSVTEMRAVLGVLRADETADHAPSLSDLSSLTDLLENANISPHLSIVEENEGVVAGLSQGVSLSLFRIVQESVNNIIKHSSARNADIAIRSSAKWVELEVTDDGRQLRSTSQNEWGRSLSSTGFGLRGITERAEVLGGETEIGPRQGASGWRVRVRVPLK